MAALESAVSDRNGLAGQNAQLWKLIEKQRAGYSQMLKEIERVRGERDAYRHRLHVLGESTNAVLKAHKERERREEKEGSLKSAALHTHVQHSESSGSLDPRQRVQRAHTDDIGQFCSALIVTHASLARTFPFCLIVQGLTAHLASSPSRTIEQQC
jgi:RalA-binding protein 1